MQPASSAVRPHSSRMTSVSAAWRAASAVRGQERDLPVQSLKWEEAKGRLKAVLPEEFSGGTSSRPPCSLRQPHRRRRHHHRCHRCCSSSRTSRRRHRCSHRRRLPSPPALRRCRRPKTRSTVVSDEEGGLCLCLDPFQPAPEKVPQRILRFLLLLLRLPSPSLPLDAALPPPPPPPLRVRSSLFRPADPPEYAQSSLLVVGQSRGRTRSEARPAAAALDCEFSASKEVDGGGSSRG